MELNGSFSAVRVKMRCECIISIYMCGVDNAGLYKLKSHRTQIKITHIQTSQIDKFGPEGRLLKLD